MAQDPRDPEPADAQPAPGTPPEDGPDPSPGLEGAVPAPREAAGGDGAAGAKAEGERRRSQAYWRANLRWVAVLLSIWFLVSFGCGILFVEPLNEIRVGGFRLGFWFAQQGSIYVFVVLIAVYVRVMNALDRKYGADRAAEE